jgi:predicted Fe-S protein YdhL (DUF1289 family)
LVHCFANVDEIGEWITYERKRKEAIHNIIDVVMRQTRGKKKKIKKKGSSRRLRLNIMR